MAGERDTDSHLASFATRMPTRDAATLVIVDQSTGIPRVLMGRRRPDQVFLPNKYVFPGGRVERSDRAFTCTDALSERDRERLFMQVGTRPSPRLASALPLAAIRETFEETGLIVGRPSETRVHRSATGGWAAFLAAGFTPRLSRLSFFARAITPPGRPRRYDTRFFFVDASEVAHRTEVTDGELSNLDWFSIDEMQSLDLPGITRVVSLDLAERLGASEAEASELPVPFYFHRNGTFERVLLSRAASAT